MLLTFSQLVSEKFSHEVATFWQAVLVGLVNTRVEAPCKQIELRYETWIKHSLYCAWVIIQQGRAEIYFGYNSRRKSVQGNWPVKIMLTTGLVDVPSWQVTHLVVNPSDMHLNSLPTKMATIAKRSGAQVVQDKTFEWEIGQVFLLPEAPNQSIEIS